MGGIEGWGCDAPPFCTLFILIPGSSLGRVCTAPPVPNVYVRGRLGERGVAASRHQCAFYALQHVELLDAAHITLDSALHGSQLLATGCRCVGWVLGG